MDDDIIEKIINRYGILGAFAVALSVMVFFTRMGFCFCALSSRNFDPLHNSGLDGLESKGRDR